MNAPSTFKVFLLVALAVLVGGLLLAQEPAAENPAAEDPAAKQTETQSSPDAAAATESPGDETRPREAEATPTPEPAAVRPPAEAAPQQPSSSAPPTGTDHAHSQRLIDSLWIFVFAVLVGFEVIAKVPPTLHTPLMSGSNAISGITLVGAVMVAATFTFSGFVGFLAVTLATINVVGGFMVTHRMLAMFKKR